MTLGCTVVNVKSKMFVCIFLKEFPGLGYGNCDVTLHGRSGETLANLQRDSTLFTTIRMIPSSRDSEVGSLGICRDFDVKPNMFVCKLID